MIRPLIAFPFAVLVLACTGPGAPEGDASDGPTVTSPDRPSQPMPQVEPPLVGADSDLCGASRFQTLIGQPEAAARSAGLPDPFRIVCHACPATMDYAPDRMTVTLDPQGRVADVTCG